MATDITDRKRVEEALRENEERLRLAAEAGRIYAFEWNVATDAVVRSPEVMSTFLGKVHRCARPSASIVRGPP